MATKSKYFLKAWSVSKDTVNEILEGCKLLDTENQSYVVRQLISNGLKKIKRERRKESA